LYSKGEGKKACVGSCALAVVVTKDKLFVAQLGDSKAKIYKKLNNRIISQKLSRTFNCEKPHQQLLLFKNFADLDIVVCKKELNKVCYVKGRLQPTRVFIKQITFFFFISLKLFFFKLFKNKILIIIIIIVKIIKF